MASPSRLTATIRSCPLVISRGRPVRRCCSRLHGGYERYRPLTALRGLGLRRSRKDARRGRATPAPAVSLLRACGLLRPITNAARAAPVGGGALRQPTGRRGLRYADQRPHAVVRGDVTLIAAADERTSSSMRMRRARPVLYRHARARIGSKTGVAGTAQPG